MGGDGQPLLSWRVAVLPCLGEQEVYQQFRLDQPRDSPANRALLERIPDVFQHANEELQPGTTVFQRPKGESYLFAPGERIAFRNITDGTSNTIAAVETVANEAVPWTKPADVMVDPANPKANVRDDDREGFYILLADGAVLFLNAEIDGEMLHQMMTRNGGEIIER